MQKSAARQVHDIHVRSLLGRRTVNTDPLPGSLVTVTSPPLARRVAAAACAAVQSTAPFFVAGETGDKLRPQRLRLPAQLSNSYHAANAARTETIACSRGGAGRAPRSEVS